MRPKFEVGEVVLLRSRSFPELNCETTVTAVYVRGDIGMFRHEDKDYLFDGQEVAYFLDIVNRTAKGNPIPWSESALRKKHTPGELSFTDLMASLSSPKLITHQA